MRLTNAGNNVSVGRRPDPDGEIALVTLKWVEALSFEEAVFFTFKEPLRRVGWRYTFTELKMYLRLNLNYEVTKAFQEFENLATILSKAFGGSSKKTSKGSNSAPMTANEILAAVQNVNAARKGK